jgi:prepilin-type N-terminal cleavage/methylation domain-containing protein
MKSPCPRPMLPPGREPPRVARAGFTLIEMIGVLAIMTMAAAVLTPGITERVGRLRAAEDAIKVAAISKAIQQSIRERQEIPGLQTWPLRAAAILGIPSQEVRNAIPTDSSTARVYLIHPSIQPTNPSSSPSLGDPVWTQPSSGAARIWEGRILILSVYRPGLPLPLKSGAAESTAVFESLWNWSYDPVTKAPPSGWPSNWARSGNCLRIERIHLASLFHKVTFSNLLQGTRDPFLQVGMNATGTLGSGATYDALYFEGTVFRLYQANPGSGSPGPLQVVHTLRGPVNFVYENDRWRIE